MLFSLLTEPRAATSKVTFFTGPAEQDIMRGCAYPARAEREGAVNMASYSVDAEPDVVSELVDLGPIPLPELRTLNHVALHKSLQHVVTQTTHVGVAASSTEGGGGGGGTMRVD
jgi:hypothetical protein